MRERRKSDWQTDLAERHPLESAIAVALRTHDSFTALVTSTASFSRLDFQVLGPGERLVEVELKAKRQPYVGWTAIRPDVPEPDLFILDELAFRKLIDAGRYGVLLVRDRPRRRWFAWTVGDLLLTSKVRANRTLSIPGRPTKAKLLLDLREAPISCALIEEALTAIAVEISAVDDRWMNIGPWHSPAGQNGEVA